MIDGVRLVSWTSHMAASSAKAGTVSAMLLFVLTWPCPSSADSLVAVSHASPGLVLGEGITAM